MKRFFFTILFLLIPTILLAQNQGLYRIGIDGGVSIANHHKSTSYSLEVKHYIKNNMNVGIKLSSARLTKSVDLEYYGNPKNYELTSRDYHILGCFDYTLYKNQMFTSYIGLGLGLTHIADLKPYISASSTLHQSGYIDSHWKPGVMLRTGFEIAFIRLGIEYFLIHKTTMEPNDQFFPGGFKFKPVSNHYLNVHLGIFFGVGRKRNSK